MLTEDERKENHRKANYDWRKNNPDIYQAYKRRYYGKTAYAPSHGYSWSPKEDIIILVHEEVDHELSKRLGRSVGAIQCRRCILKKRIKEKIEDQDNCSECNCSLELGEHHQHPFWMEQAVCKKCLDYINDPTSDYELDNHED